MKKAFTIVEVSILFVIFLIVAFLVAPLSLDDSMQINNISSWKNVQQEFANIFYSINMQKDSENFNFRQTFSDVLNVAIKHDIEPYRITFANGTFPNNAYRFDNYKLTTAGKILAYKMFEEPEGEVYGYVMYDINGSKGPNVWGKDVFGFNIYADKFEPFCKNDPVNVQKQDCSKGGTGLCCSNYYLIGGSFN